LLGGVRGVLGVAGAVNLSGPWADLLVVALVGLGLLGWWALFDIVKRSAAEWPTTGLSRWSWAVVAVLIPFGGLAYLIIGPPEVFGTEDSLALRDPSAHRHDRAPAGMIERWPDSGMVGRWPDSGY
jgi:hypothetical protein